MTWAAIAFGWPPDLTRRQRVRDLEPVRDRWLDIRRRQLDERR